MLHQRSSMPHYEHQTSLYALLKPVTPLVHSGHPSGRVTGWHSSNCPAHPPHSTWWQGSSEHSQECAAPLRQATAEAEAVRLPPLPPPPPPPPRICINGLLPEAARKLPPGADCIPERPITIPTLPLPPTLWLPPTPPLPRESLWARRLPSDGTSRGAAAPEGAPISDMDLQGGIQRIGSYTRGCEGVTCTTLAVEDNCCGFQ